MMKLNCAPTTGGRPPFTVNVVESQTVDELKLAIARRLGCEDKASDLQVFPAKTTNGTWLPDECDAAKELRKGNIFPGIQKLLDREKILPTKTLQNWLFEKNKMPQPSTGQIRVLVVVPGEIRFSSRTPKPLVATEGAHWDFQNPLNNNSVADAVRTHYNAWKAGNTNKKKHPLFVCLDGPGAGKSRMLGEFPTLVKEYIFAKEAEDPEMMNLLKEAFTNWYCSTRYVRNSVRRQYAKTSA